jgi:Flp pilus assembly pilin Flp
MREKPNLRSLWHDTRGVYQTEYTIVLVLVAILGAVAIATLSVPLIQYHKSILTMIVSPVP